MFKVGDIVKYSPKFCGPGEEKYIHEVKEVNPDTGRCLISTLNTSLTLGSTELVDEEMIQPAKKYEVIVTWTKDHEQKYLITDTETKTFFEGYDFMGSVDWAENTGDAHLMDVEEAEQIVKDLESADEPAEPETIHEVTQWNEHDYRIVKKIPEEYMVWNVAGIVGHSDYLPLCIVFPGTYVIVPDKLLAIKMPQNEQKILHDCSMRTGAGNLKQCRKLLNRKNLKDRTRLLAEKALPLFEKYTV